MPQSGTSVGLQIVGSVVGSYFGPLGTYLGGMVGSIVGNLIDPSVAEGPKLGDLSVRASTYGKAIPIIYGYNRVGGNIIWNKGIRELEIESGQDWNGTKQVTYAYDCTFAIALGVGEMRNLHAIYANGKKLWTRTGYLQSLVKAQERSQLARFFSPEAATAADFLDNYSDDALLPDFTPWVLTPTASSSSGGNGTAYGKAASFLSGAEFDALEWFPGSLDQPASVFIKAPTPAYRGTAYLVFKNLKLARFGNQIPTIECVVAGRRESSVDQILADMCDRANADIDEVVPRGALSRFPVTGFAVSAARNVVAAIRPLMTAYPFDACDQGGVVRFTPRRRGPYCTILQSEMGARAAADNRRAVFPIERVPDLELPREASITYVDALNSYQASTQIAQRATGSTETKINESLALTLTSTQARAIAERLLWEGWLSREQIKEVSVSQLYGFLQAGDLFASNVPGGYTLYRILNHERGDNGVIMMAVAREDRQAYDGDMPGGDPFIYEDAEPYSLGVRAYNFNAPVLTPYEDTTGFHWSIDSEDAAFSSATLYRSTDGKETWDFATITNQRDMTGDVVGTLGSARAEIWDRINTLTVDLINESDTPESLSEDELLNNRTRNLVWVGAADGSHGELLQFATATLVSGEGNRYALSDLLRGRRATEHEIALHAADEVAVFIPHQSVGSLDYGQSDWNQRRYYLGVDLGLSQYEGDLFEFTTTGERKAPRAGVHGRGVRDSSNNLTLTWLRRNRLFPPTLGNGAVTLDDEAAEIYEVDVIVGGSPDVARTITATTPSIAYSAAQQSADGITPGNPVIFRVYQISATYGRGHSATFTV